MTTLKQSVMRLDSIEVGERFREDYGNIDELVQSIKTNGLLQPIVVSSGGHLLAGGRRFLACSKAELTTIPVTIVETTNELSEREIELIENIHRKDMAWQERAKLEKRIFDLKCEQDPNWSQNKQAEMTDASKGGVNRRLQVANAMELIPELAECRTEDDAVKLLKRLDHRAKIQTLTAEIKDTKHYRWAADHYCIGDALEEMRKCASGICTFAEVDPPYGIDLTNVRDRNKDRENINAYNEVSKDKFPKWFTEVAYEVHRLLAHNSFAVFWFGPTWHEVVRDALRLVGFQLSDIPAIWYKTSFSGQTNSPDTSLGNCYETFFVCRKGNPGLVKKGRSNVFAFDPIPGQNKLHPTEKPIELITEILDTLAWPGGVVLCPFLGSGVTLRAAYQQRRVGFGWDLSEEYRQKFLAQVTLEFLENRSKFDQETSNEIESV